jgi:hypothetical protein
LDNQNERQKGEPIVPWDHVWRAGANEATMFVVTDDVLINGQPLKAGTYSLHTVPGKEEWTIIFNNDAGQWGSFTYDEKKDALRVKTKPQAVSENQEFLMYSFDPVTDNSAQVNIRWEKTRVPFTVEVKDVKAVWRTKADALIAANPTNEVLPLQVANAYAGDKNWDEALKFIDQSIKVKETFRNLSAKANILWSAGKKEEALTVADAAIAKGSRSASHRAFRRPDFKEERWSLFAPFGLPSRLCVKCLCTGVWFHAKAQNFIPKAQRNTDQKDLVKNAAPRAQSFRNPA